MSTDASVTKQLVETLEDGKNGFAKGAEKLASSNQPQLSETFAKYSQQRAGFAAELNAMAESYGDDTEDAGTLTAAVHRGWMTLKDALSGDDPQGVLDVAAQGENHAVTEYEKALDDDISDGLRVVVQRQFAEIQAAYSAVSAMRAAND